MRKTFAIILAFSFCIMAIPSTTTADITKPEWDVGQGWRYYMEMDYSEVLLKGYVDYDITGTMELVGHEVFIVSFDGGGSFSGPYSGKWEFSGYEYFRTSDHAKVRVQATISMSYTVMGLKQRVSMETTETYDPPLDEMDYPIELYEIWSASSTVTSSLVMFLNDEEMSRETESRSVLYTYECTDEKTITVRAGTYTAYEIEYTKGDGSYEISFVSPDSPVEVKSESYDASGTRMGVVELAPPRSGEDQGTLLLILLAVLIPVIVAVTLVTVIVVRRRRRRIREQLWFLQQEQVPPPPPPPQAPP